EIIPETMMDFASNDYYGLAKTHSPNSKQLSYGATGSRLISGNSELAEKLENFLANFHESESALLFNSGYMANIGLLSSVADRNTTIIADEYIHASLKDGIRLSGASYYKFKHNNLQDLEQKLRNVKNGNKCLVVVESVYSMEGDFAPLQEIVKLKQKYPFEIIVDEAHATGIFGNGKGRVVEENLQNEVFARVVTFGKAIGTHGAAVLGTHILKEYLINFARSFIYTTALPDIILQKTLDNHTFIIENKLYRDIKKRVLEFKEIVSKSALSNYLLPSSSPIQIILAEGILVENIENICRQKGFFVKAIKYPTVPKNQERIRICLHLHNTSEQMNDLVKIMEKNWQ
ncbi:MAG: pyridoxal phosphate-dependent aminotransferase family protein, partial [Bacteroidetes bacterium]